MEISCYFVLTIVNLMGGCSLQYLGHAGAHGWIHLWQPKCMTYMRS